MIAIVRLKRIMREKAIFKSKEKPVEKCNVFLAFFFHEGDFVDMLMNSIDEVKIFFELFVDR